MDKMNRSWVGADPGGKDRFGLTFVDILGAARCETVSSVEENRQPLLPCPPLQRLRRMDHLYKVL